jgi:hypothetical protein
MPKKTPTPPKTKLPPQVNKQIKKAQDEVDALLNPTMEMLYGIFSGQIVCMVCSSSKHNPFCLMCCSRSSVPLGTRMGAFLMGFDANGVSISAFKPCFILSEDDKTYSVRVKLDNGYMEVTVEKKIIRVF